MDKYHEALSYLDSLVNYEQLPTQAGLRERRLERMHTLLRALGDPQQQLRMIHVAGTKGKGSVCAMLYAILQRCGVTAGLYTSPHLESVRERIRVSTALADDDRISQAEFADGVGRVRATVEATAIDGGPVTYFEALTALALEHFARSGVRWAGLETGLGGRLDATNATQPAVAVLTPISIDHTDVLGHTLAAIAVEKAGVIKPGQTVISAPQPLPARRIIADHAARAGASVIEIGRDVCVEDVQLSHDGTVMTVRGLRDVYRELTLPLLGRHQADNAATAIAALEIAQASDPALPLTSAAIRAGLADVVWPGRGELIPSSPPWLLDGAHNEASAACLAQLLRDVFPQTRVALLVGMSHGKDVAGLARALAPVVREVWATEAPHPRALPAAQLAAHLRAWMPRVHVAPNMSEALTQAHASDCDLLVITGSLFLVGAARHHATVLAR